MFTVSISKNSLDATARWSRPDNCENCQDRREPAIQLDKEPAVIICEPDPTVQLATQNDQLMSERCIFGLKSSLLFDLNGADKTVRTKHINAIMMR